MLGKFGEGGIDYVTEAKNFNCRFYNLDKWNELKSLVGNDLSQMWAINKQFLLNNQGKTFYMSHNPDFATDIFKDEIELIKKWPGFKGFVKEGQYWKAIFE